MTATRQPPVQYMESFVAPDEAEQLFDLLYTTVPWEQKHITMFGKTLPVPRETCWFGETGYAYSGIRNDPHPWTAELLCLREEIEKQTGGSYNSCLANLYRDGSHKVDWHADNEPGLGPTPMIASLSLGATRTFKLRHVETKTTFDYELHSGSLLVMYGSCQTEWLHAVPRRSRVDQPRINLTFRSFSN